MIKARKTYIKWLLVFLSAFIPFRELIAYYTVSYIKFLPDILIFGLLVYVIFKNKFKLNLKIYDYFYITFIIIGLISTLLNKSSLLAFALETRSIATMYALFYILRIEKLHFKDYEFVAKSLVFVSIVITLLGYIEFLSDKKLAFVAEWANGITYGSNFARMYSIIYNPNTYSIFTFLIIYFCYVIFNEKESIKKSLFYLVSFIGIFLAASRSALIVVIIFLLFLFVDGFKSKKYTSAAIITTMFVISFLGSLSMGYLKNKIDFDKIEKKLEILDKSENKNNIPNNNEYNVIIDKNTIIKPPKNSQSNFATINRWSELSSGKTINDSAADGRIFNIKKGLEIWKEHPVLGTGFGTYGSAGSMMVYPQKLYEKYELSKSFYADNDYVRVFVETGIIGVTLYFGFILTLFLSIKKYKYVRLMYLIFFILGMFCNIFELQVICFVIFLLHTSIINNKIV